jgi:hypothetical protein
MVVTGTAVARVMRAGTPATPPMPGPVMMRAGPP